MSKSRVKPRASRQQPRESSKVDELGQRVREWAVHEMVYPQSSDSLPSLDEIKALLNGGLAGALEYVVSYVRSPGTGESIRGNIHLHSGGVAPAGDDGEREQLLEQRAQLQREANSLRLAVAQLETDVSRTRKDIARTDAEVSAASAILSELSRKTAVLSGYTVRCQETLHVLREFIRRIHQRNELFSHTTSEPSFFARSSGPGGCSKDGSRSVVLESACTREVRGVCGQVEQLVQLLEGNGSGPEVERVRQQVWSRVESLLSSQPPASLLSSLVEITQWAATELHQTTQTLDLTRDARQLKYWYDQSDGLRDIAARQSLLQTVEEHLTEAQLSHIRRSVEAERAGVAARKAQHLLAGRRAQLEERLSLQHQDDTQGLELARSCLHLELEAEGCSAALQALSSLCAGLSSARDQRRAALEQLRLKHSRIQEFARAAECRQGQIQALVRHSSAAKDRLQSQKTELELYIRQSVCGHEAQLVSVASGLVGVALQEERLFSRLSLSRMLRPPGMLSPTCELSINRLDPVQLSGHPSWEGILHALGLPSHCCPERVIPCLTELMQKVECLCQDARRSERVVAEMRGRTVDRQHAEGVLAVSQERDRQLLEEVVPALRQCLSLASQGLATGTIVQQMLQEWWEQPAQHLVPWVMCEGMGVRQWVEQWKVLALKLRQLTTSGH